MLSWHWYRDRSRFTRDRCEQTGGTLANSGDHFGTEILLDRVGADLYLTARDMQKGQKVIQDILASSSEGHGKLELLHLELDSLQSVRDCADSFLKKSKTLNVLINNAGTLVQIARCTKFLAASPLGISSSATSYLKLT